MEIDEAGLNNHRPAHFECSDRKIQRRSVGLQTLAAATSKTSHHRRCLWAVFTATGLYRTHPAATSPPKTPKHLGQPQIQKSVVKPTSDVSLIILHLFFYMHHMHRTILNEFDKQFKDIHQFWFSIIKRSFLFGKLRLIIKRWPQREIRAFGNAHNSSTDLVFITRNLRRLQ